MLLIAVLHLFMAQAGDAAITNAYVAGDARPRLATEQVTLYQPRTAWTYSHHPFITHYRGRFYAMWSNGRRDEDAPGQRILMCHGIRFDAWSEPRPLVDSQRDAEGELVLTAAGFHQYGGALIAYFGQYAYSTEGARPKGDTHHRATQLRAMKTTDGEHWVPVGELGLPVVPNFGPQATRSGRLILCGNVTFPYTDDPSGLGGWRLAGIYPPEMTGDLFDDSEGFRIVQRRAGWAVGLCEGSFYQTDDGVLHMLLRSGTERLWLTESSDDGETWSAPRPTDFTDNVAKFHFGRLPDGRFYYVGNPDPEPRGRRNPLVLSLSRDGRRFDAHFVLADAEYTAVAEGMHKGGSYGYPHSLVHEGSLHVIVSMGKESVAVMRVPLSAL